MSHWVASDNRVKTHPVVGKRLVSVILSVPLPLGSTRDGSAMQMRSMGKRTLWRPKDVTRIFLAIFFAMVRISSKNTEYGFTGHNVPLKILISKKMRSPTLRKHQATEWHNLFILFNFSYLQKFPFLNHFFMAVISQRHVSVIYTKRPIKNFELFWKTCLL